MRSATVSHLPLYPRVSIEDRVQNARDAVGMQLLGLPSDIVEQAQARIEEHVRGQVNLQLAMNSVISVAMAKARARGPRSVA